MALSSALTSTRPFETASQHWDCWAGSSRTAHCRLKVGLFPWHDENLRELFEQVSEAGVDRVQEMFEKWQGE